jgi:hypothetical protein
VPSYLLLLAYYQHWRGVLNVSTTIPFVLQKGHIKKDQFIRFLRAFIGDRVLTTVAKKLRGYWWMIVQWCSFSAVLFSSQLGAGGSSFGWLHRTEECACVEVPNKKRVLHFLCRCSLARNRCRCQEHRGVIVIWRLYLTFTKLDLNSWFLRYFFT